MDLDLSLKILGSILESDNSAVSTFGRKLPIQGFQKKNSVNLINLLTQLIMVCLFMTFILYVRITFATF